ncbi:type II toxin-antitoxin system VapC family toxin [Armatimonas sp.]|uniref:type II toxin-antitoxin system VapC family toxin n=1 Tax=Armatimonas sp. TaxID=1872638 RepID=UPI00374D1CF4
MKLLLDTHIFLWLITNDPQLSVKARLAIEDGNNDIFLSVVSIWEITIKYKLGKLPLPQSPEIYLPTQRQLHSIATLPLEEGCIQQLIQLPDLHRDPFDRMLISQALHHGLTLITDDHAIQNYPVPLL